MTTGITRFTGETTPQLLVDAVRETGAAIVEGLLDADSLARLEEEIMPWVEATAPGQDDFSGRRTTRTGALVARSPSVRDRVMDPLVTDAARTFLGPFCAKIQLHLTQLIRILPGQASQLLHRDRLAWGGFLPAALEPQFNTIWAVTDFTSENGATQVVPGSPAWDPARQAEEDEIVLAEMPAGSVLIYSGSVIHGGGANRSETPRMGLNITYALGWLRQEENQYLSCPPEIARELSPELREMLGYDYGSYALGYFTPPLPPGEGPEVVSPEWLFSGGHQGFGSELLDAIVERAKSGAM